MWANIFLWIFKTTFKPSLYVESNNVEEDRDTEMHKLNKEKELFQSADMGTSSRCTIEKMKIYKTDIKYYHWGIKAGKISFTKNEQELHLISFTSLFGGVIGLGYEGGTRD